MNKKCYFFHWFVFVLASFFAEAGQQSLVFDSFELPSQLQYQQTTLPFKSPDGSLWFGFANGVLQVLGNHSQYMPYQNKQALAKNRKFIFKAVFFSGQVLIAADEKLYRYDLHSNQLQPFGDNDLVPDELITGMVLDGDGNLWITTYSHVFRIKAGSTDVEEIVIDPALFSAEKKYRFFQHLLFDKNTVYISSFFDGVVAINVEDPSRAELSEVAGSTHYQSVAAYKDTLLVNTNDGIYQVMDGNSTQLLAGTLSGVTIAESQAKMWFIQHNQLYRYDFNTAALTPVPLRLRSNEPLSPVTMETMMLDVENTLWITTQAHGIIHYNGLKTKIFPYSDVQKSRFYNVNATLRDNSGKWLFATSKGLLDESGNVLFERPVYSIYQSDDHFWLGGSSELIGSADLKNFQSYKVGQFKDNKITSLSADAKGGVWLKARYTPLSRYNPQTRKFTRQFDIGLDERETQRIRFIGIDKIDNNKLNIISDKRVLSLDITLDTLQTHFEAPDDNEIDYVSHTGGEFYLSMRGGQMFRVLGNSTTAIRLPDGAMRCVVSQNESVVWIVTTLGYLYRWQRDSNQWFLVDQSKGIPARGLDGKVCVLDDDRLLFSAPDGLMVLPLDDFGINESHPQLRMFVEHETLDGLGRQPVKNTIELQHDSFPLTINAYHSSYIDLAHSAVKFRYPAHSGQWQVAPKGKIVINQRPAGQYRLQVQAVNHDNIAGNVKEIVITVTPPLWQTGWAYICYVLVLLLMMYWFSALRTRQLSKRAKKLEHTVLLRTSELASEKQQVEHLLSLKEQELINVSHELRTPITLICGPLKSAIAEMDEGASRSKLQMAYRNSQRLGRMVEQLLLMDRFNLMQSMDKTAQCANQVMAFIIESFTQPAQKKGVKLTLSSNPPCYLLFVPDALEKVIMNLISNAIKYTPSGGHITVSTDFDPDGYYHIRVKDNGKGIKQAHLAQIFNKFFRVTDEDSEKVTGAGIGLALVKVLVEHHNGKITVNSEWGVGTEFVVSFDAQSVTESPQVINRVQSELHSQEIEALIPNNESLALSARLATDSEQQTKILIIEDNIDMQHYIVDTLSTDYHCMVADNGKLGWEAAIEHSPDLIICDVMMPVMDGFTATRRIKEDMRTSHIPVIILTARGDRDSRLQGWRALADEFLAKPFDEQELLLRVQNLLSIRALFRQGVAGTIAANKPLIMDKQEDVNPKDSEFLTRLESLLAKNYGQADFVIDDLADGLYMSKRQLQRKLKALTDYTPTEYLRIYRLQQANRLIAEGQQISDVTFHAGFSSHTYFGRCFKAYFKMTPSEFQHSLVD
ncbi:MAG: response regulator [Algicola sp.]|nr:response regulator [Algicola sp.]